MQYVPLADFFGFLGRAVQSVPASEKPVIHAELEQLYASGKSIEVSGKSISLENAKSFLEKLDHPAMVVFDQWITQFSALKNLLLNGQLSKNNFDRKLVLEHRLFPEFSRFISPFLLPEMLRKIQSANDKDFLLAGSFLNLLDQDGKLVAQDKLSSWLKVKLAVAYAAAKAAKTEQNLSQEISFVVSDEIIEFVNQFDKSFYATKIAYIDQVLEIMKLPASTQRLGGWLATQLKKLDLNPEHVEKIREITGTVKEGKVNFLNKSGKVSVSFNATRSVGIVLAAILIGTIYLVWFHPFKDAPTQKLSIESKSSFEQFTEEERRQMDSLIKSMPSQRSDELEQYVEDKFLHLAPVEMAVLFREPYKNTKAEQFHADCMKDQALMESGQVDSCTPYPAGKFKTKIYPDFHKLSENSGFQPVFLQNESVYQVLVLVFRDEASAPVFSALIAAGEKISFEMNPGESILFLPGNDWAAFHTSAAAELPSENFKHHFCHQDENFKAMLFSPYRLKTINVKTVKLMLNESPRADTDFFLLDLYEALEKSGK